MTFNQFSDIFRPYEKEIADFYHYCGDLIGLRPKLNVIYFYLMLHPQLTQKEIMELAGYSQSNVSLLLQIMLSSGMVEKKLISGTNTSFYELKVTGFSFSYASFYANDEYGSLIPSLEKYIVSLENLVQKKSAGSALLSSRLKEFLFLNKKNRLSHTKQLVLDILNSKNEFVKEEALTLIPINFSPECEAIEKLIIEKLIESKTLLIKKNPSHSKILAYFFTRRVLTQKQLQNLTGFSAGVISESLKYFLNALDVREVSAQETHLQSKTKLYVLDFIYYNMYFFYSQYNHEVSSYFPQFQASFQKLSQLSWKDSRQPGYSELYTFLTRYLIPTLKHEKENHSKIIQPMEEFYDFYSSIRPDRISPPPKGERI